MHTRTYRWCWMYYIYWSQVHANMNFTFCICWFNILLYMCKHVYVCAHVGVFFFGMHVCMHVFTRKIVQSRTVKRYEETCPYNTLVFFECNVCCIYVCIHICIRAHATHMHTYTHVPITILFVLRNTEKGIYNMHRFVKLLVCACFYVYVWDCVEEALFLCVFFCVYVYV